MQPSCDLEVIKCQSVSWDVNTLLVIKDDHAYIFTNDLLKVIYYLDSCIWGEDTHKHSFESKLWGTLWLDCRVATMYNVHSFLSQTSFFPKMVIYWNNILKKIIVMISLLFSFSYMTRPIILLISKMYKMSHHCQHRL